MKKISILLAAAALILACGKEKAPEEEAPNLSPVGKQWIIESSDNPYSNTIGFMDLSLGNGKALYVPGGIKLSTLTRLSDFYFYGDIECESYHCVKFDDDDNTYALICGLEGFKFTALSEDTGFGSFDNGTNRYDLIFKTMNQYLKRTLTPVNYIGYNFETIYYTDGNGRFTTSENSKIGFSKLNAKNYGVVRIEGDGANTDYSGKNVNGKIVFVPDGGSLSLKEKRAIALANGAVAIIIYHPVEHGIDIPYKNTFDSIPTEDGIPIGIFYEDAQTLDGILKATNVHFQAGELSL